MAKSRTCHHVLAKGNPCGSLAMHNQNYCYFHMMTRHRLRRMRQAERDHQPLQFGVFESSGEVQLALGDLANAVLRGSIETARGWLVLQVLQTAARNSRANLYFDETNEHFRVFEPAQLDGGSQPDSDEADAPPKLPPQSVSLPAEAESAS